jgi:hypothetical protein
LSFLFEEKKKEETSLMIIPELSTNELEEIKNQANPKERKSLD